MNASLFKLDRLDIEGNESRSATKQWVRQTVLVGRSPPFPPMGEPARAVKAPVIRQSNRKYQIYNSKAHAYIGKVRCI